MRIRVPIEILNDAASNLRKTEAAIVRINNTLNRNWSGLRLESKSRHAVESKINQAQGMADRLSSQARNLNDYLNQVGVRFIETDRQLSVRINNSYKSADCSQGYSSNVSKLIQNKHFEVSAERAKLDLGFGNNTVFLSAGALAWVGMVAGFYSGLSFMPGSGEAGLISETFKIKKDAGKIVEGASESADLYDFGGKATSVVATRVVAGKIGSITKFAVGAALIGTGVLASAPVWVTMAVSIGAGIAVGYGISALFNVQVNDDSISNHISNAAENIYRSTADVAKKVGLVAMQSGALATEVVLSKAQLVGDNVGSAVNNAGEIAKGLGGKIKLLQNMGR